MSRSVDVLGSSDFLLYGIFGFMFLSISQKIKKRKKEKLQSCSSTSSVIILSRVLYYALYVHFNLFYQVHKFSLQFLSYSKRGFFVFYCEEMISRNKIFQFPLWKEVAITVSLKIILQHHLAQTCSVPFWNALHDSHLSKLLLVWFICHILKLTVSIYEQMIFNAIS